MICPHSTPLVSEAGREKRRIHGADPVVIIGRAWSHATSAPAQPAACADGERPEAPGVIRLLHSRLGGIRTLRSALLQRLRGGGGLEVKLEDVPGGVN